MTATLTEIGGTQMSAFIERHSKELFLWVVGGAWHAKRRIRKGQPPMLYHRVSLSLSQQACILANHTQWLVSSRHRQRYSQAQPYGYGQGGQPGFQMNNWNYAPPPPAYGHDAPPGYQAPPGPPPGASKVNPDQTTGVVEVTPHNGESSGGAGPSIQPPAPTQAANPFQSQR
ncbi:hypothetical protein FH972_025811 [Carpinus fangiana]|uniref:Uncharacterized protein n=1 Tax=Carpinus fangiana TaxID=176857 RepID=A0A5N6L2N7_9ROSI|nr:hypothetical protein FH972_025811 [Carpinus fangiana]